MENNGYCTVNECPMRNANGHCMTTGCIKMSSLTNIPGAVRTCDLTPETIEEIANAVVEKLKDRKWGMCNE